MAQGRTSGKNDGARIASGTRVRGRIGGDGDLTVDGEVEGDITLRGSLTVGEGATVTSDVEADNVVIAGKLEGNVNAGGQVRVVSGAVVRGDLRGAHGVSIEEGAQFAGRLDCDFDLPPELEGSSRR